MIICLNTLKPCLMFVYQEREEDCDHLDALDDPHADHADDLDDGEDVHALGRNMTEVDQIWLVLG